MIIIPSNVLGAPSDPFFSNTVLLLKTVSVSGATNNTFVDHSPNNFVPTRNGDVTQGTLSPYTDTVGDPVPVVGGSVFFDGSGDHLSYTSTTTLNFGTGDFTVEGWIMLGNTGYSQTIIGGTATGSFGLRFGTAYAPTSGATAGLNIYRSATGDYEYATFAFKTGQWYHIAAVRQSNVIKFFVNGTQVTTQGSGISSFNFGTETTVRVGASDILAENFSGSISNLRVTKSAVYTANFTPSTTPLTAISGTSLLTCQSPTAITDASTNAHTITRVGDAQAGSLSPFGYGSVYLDGSGDYLTLSDTSGVMAVGTGSFTVEAWVRRIAATATYESIIDGTSVDNNVTGFGFGLVSDNRPYLYSQTFLITSNIAITPGAWNHVALVRNGTTATIYVNGVAGGSATVTNNFTDLRCAVGTNSHSKNANYFTGSISNLRVVKNVAAYTGNFTPPTAPLTAISGTSLLTAQDRGSIVDASSNALAITRVGDAAPNAETPFAPKPSGRGWSAYFSGSTDITLTSNELLAPRTGNFTFEGWMYPTSYSATNGWGLIHTVINGGLYVGKIGSEFYVHRAGQGGLISTTTIPPLNTWTHVVAVRSGTTLSLYFNGTRVATGTTSHDFVAGAVSLAGGSGNQTIGHTSNIRLVKGVAVYDPTQTTLTVPTSPLTAVPGTSLLVFQDNRFRDNSPYNFTLAPTATPPEISRFSPFPVANTVNTTLSSTGSVFFDGSGDYMTVPHSSIFNMGTGAFTAEFWMNPTAAPSGFAATMISSYNGATQGWEVQWRASPQAIRLGLGDNALIDRDFPSSSYLNRWTHIAVSREAGGNTRMFFNGVQQGATVNLSSSSLDSTSTTFNIGYLNFANGQNYTGFLSNVRVVKGTALYTSDFTPSTSPITAISGTSLLTCQDSSTVTDASTNNLTVTRFGDTKAVEAAPFKRSVSLYGGSGYFDGTGDYLQVASTPALSFGTGDFTIEGWFLREDTNTLRTLFSIGVYSNGVMFRTDLFDFMGTSVNPSSWLPSPYVWFHVAVTRANGVLRVFIDGVVKYTSTNATSHPQSSSTIGTSGHAPSTEGWKGYIANFRVVKGLAVYTAPFTPPAAPVTAISGTSLLLNFDNAGVYDATGQRNLLTRGATATSTTSRKYEVATQAFNNTDNTVLAPAGPVAPFVFGTGDFCIEFWANRNSTAQEVFYDQRPLNTQGLYPTIYCEGATLYYYVNSGNQINGGTLAAGTWYHIAVCRAASQTRLFVNGVQQGVTYADTTSYLCGAGRPLLGNGYRDGTTDYRINSYIEGLRVSRVGRYTANFTVPSEPFPVA